MPRTVAGTRQILIDLLQCMTTALEEGESTDEWLDTFEEIGQQVNTLIDLEAEAT